MSKKMMKRSLVLGALMAFVITGSAWANAPEGWETNPSNGWYTPVEGNTDGVIQSGEYYCKFLGDYGKNINVYGGKVKIGAGVTIQKGNNLQGVGGVYGGYSDSSSLQPVVKNCIVEINGGKVNSPIYGGCGKGDSDTSSLVENNSVNISGDTVVGGSVYGGYNYGQLGDAESNKVNVSGGIISGSVIGGNASAYKANASAYKANASANNNSIYISGGTVTGDIYGAIGFAYKAIVDIVDNDVNVSGGTITGNLYAAYSDTTRDNPDTVTNVKDNTVNISGKANVEAANLFGSNLTADRTTGNTLNITGWKGSESEADNGYGTIGSAQNFNAINIIEGSSVSFKTALNDNDVVVNVKGATWNVDKANTVGSAYFDATSTLEIDGATFANNDGENSNYALNGNGTLTVEQGAKLTVEGIDNNTYNIAKGFENITEAKDKWVVTNLNSLMQGTWTADKDKGLQLNVVAKEAGQMATEMGVSVSTAQSVANVTTAAQAAKDDGVKADANGIGDAKAVAFVEAMSGVDSKVAGQVFEAVSKMAEAGGNSATAANIVKNVTGVTNDRLSFNCGHSAPHKDGHGVGLFEEGSGADVWVEYVHGKDKVEDMKSTAGTTSYEGQYNGIVMGVDFKKVNKFQSGIAFNYGEGDTNSVGSAARTHSDYDFWGIGYYGNIHNDDSNVIFDIGYAKTDSEVENTNATGVSFKASPETTTWTAGVKVEKLYQNENVQIVPYTGLRFMSIDPEDYTTECASSKYQMERQNVWLLPLGVSIKQEIANDNGWTVSPRVDLSYIWAFGDTDSEMEFSTLGTKTNIGYEVMDDGSVLGLVGIEAHKGQWGFGVSYSYQKGDHSESKKWFIDANYSF